MKWIAFYYFNDFNHEIFSLSSLQSLSVKMHLCYSFSFIQLFNEYIYFSSFYTGKHGAAMVAYFLFLRWLLYMNMIIFLLNFGFLVLPQFLFQQTDGINSTHITSHSNQTASNGTIISDEQPSKVRTLSNIYLKTDWISFRLSNLPHFDGKCFQSMH